MPLCLFASSASNVYIPPPWPAAVPLLCAWLKASCCIVSPTRMLVLHVIMPESPLKSIKNGTLSALDTQLWCNARGRRQNKNWKKRKVSEKGQQRGEAKEAKRKKRGKAP